MKRVKNTLAALVAVMMLISCFTISAGAAPFDVELLGEGYTSGISYVQTFESNDGSFKNGSANTETIVVKDGALIAVDENAEAGKCIQFEGNFPKTVTDPAMIEFDLKVDGTIGIFDIIVLAGGADQVRFHLDFDADQVSGRGKNGNDGREIVYEKSFKDEEAKVKLIMSYAEDKYYLYINDILYIDGWCFIGATDKAYSDAITVKAGDDPGKTGTVTFDNFKVSGANVSAMPKSSTAEPAFSADFDGYNTSAGPISASNITEVSSGVIDTAANINIITVEKDPDTQSNAIHFYHPASDNEPTYVYWNNGVDGVSDYGAGTYVIEYSVKSDGLYYAHLGYGNSAWWWTKFEVSPGVVVMSNGTSDHNISINLLDGKYHKVTWCITIGADESTKDKYSAWIDGVNVANNLDTRESLGKISSYTPICFRKYAYESTERNIWVDDISFYVVSEDYLNMNKIRSADISLEDICAVSDSTADLRGEEGIITKAGLATNACTVIYKDSKGYIKENALELPLYADKTDIAAIIQCGSEKETKVFKNVLMPAAYTFGTETAATTVSNVDGFEAGTIIATRANETSDIEGRLKLFAAIYDSESGKLIKVQQQNSTLGDDGKFEFKLDLAAFDSDELKNAEVKLFVWESGSLIPIK